jgi:hypothetical protein
VGLLRQLLSERKLVGPSLWQLCLASPAVAALAAPVRWLGERFLKRLRI